MIQKLKPLLLAVLVSILFIFLFPLAQANSSKAELEAKLSLMTAELQERDHFKVRAEILNVSDHPVPIPRDLNLTDRGPSKESINSMREPPTQILYPNAASPAAIARIG
jgi:hypothetical protein